MKFFCLCLSITVTVMFTGRITTSKRHCLNSCLLSIGESNLCSKSEVYTLCCYITWTDSIYCDLRWTERVLAQPVWNTARIRYD